MGIYLNPTPENFRRTLASEVYVDKTMMIAELSRFIDAGNNYVCISRPRRFGKTIASEMLSAYFSKGQDTHSLFDNLKIANAPSYEDNINKYNVIKLDMNSEYQSAIEKNDLIKIITFKIKKELIQEFPSVDVPDFFSIADTIMEIHNKTGERFIIMLDEYDVLVRENVEKQLFDEYLSFLNSLFKSATLRPAISLAYLTGILPIVRDKVQSKLNNFEEYTIIDSGVLSEFTGFTSDEVKSLCEKYDIDFDTCRLWYDGYKQKEYEIYNPQ
ncbi:MAG: AAA family ATPase, partial [Lachnospiraceae bacterium]|nr:AAA family ATPase [Lachnospiraceae bacterium]